MTFDKNDSRSYRTHWQDPIYFAQTLEALEYWYDNSHYFGEAPRVPIKNYAGVSSHFVKRHFDSSYKEKADLRQRNMGEACDLLITLADKCGGMEGVYAFFRAMSHVNADNPKASKDDEVFKRALTKVFAPYFEKVSMREAMHGTAAIGMTLAAPVYPAMAPSALMNALNFKHHFQKRRRHRESPSLEIVEKMLPLVPNLHVAAQEAVNIMNEVKPSNISYPDIPPVNMTALENSLRNIRISQEVAYYHGHGNGNGNYR